MNRESILAFRWFRTGAKTDDGAANNGVSALVEYGAALLECMRTNGDSHAW